jgi:Fe-S-cluster-containing hydrogenase component 2
MIQIALHEQACRGCQMCVDLCPTKVFSYDEVNSKATVNHNEDCIGCLSCAYLCPSGALTHEGHLIVRNFYRDMDFCNKMEKFL